MNAGVRLVVDVRRFPGSRRHPHVASAAMAGWLPDGGVAYRWAEPLGGRRSAQPGSPHVALRNQSFRAYADHMTTPAFHAAVATLLTETAATPTAVLCSESLWWRCHRRLLADHVTLVHGMAVRHLLHDGRETPHPLTEGVRRDGDDVVYDAGAAPPLPGLS